MTQKCLSDSKRRILCQNVNNNVFAGYPCAPATLDLISEVSSSLTTTERCFSASFLIILSIGHTGPSEHSCFLDLFFYCGKVLRKKYRIIFFLSVCPQSKTISQCTSKLASLWPNVFSQIRIVLILPFNCHNLYYHRTYRRAHPWGVCIFSSPQYW